MNNTEPTSEALKKCFVIMPISDSDGYEKAHFTRVYEHIIKPAVENAGFIPIRADNVSKANHIMIDILKEILACEIAICDLSSRNPNVFYELGVRQAFNKKTVLIKDKKTVMPFDINAIRTLEYSENLRIDEVKDIIPKLTKSITDTYHASDKEINSLVQLLSIEPASLVDKVNLSQESSLILNAIADLSKNFGNKSKGRQIDRSRNFKISNGEYIYEGSGLFSNSEYLGEFVFSDSDFIYVKTLDDDVKMYSVSDTKFYESLTSNDTVPF